MVEVIRTRYGFNSPAVFSAMLKIPREEFVPQTFRLLAYDDMAVAIDFGQTISQPYTVAFMTDLLSLKKDDRVLEIGTGSGYQAAVLSLLARDVYSVERIPELAMKARKLLKSKRYKNVFIMAGNGEFGWKAKSPFDAILITAGMEKVPQGLFDQLKNGGVLVAPVGKGRDKEMVKYTKKGRRLKIEKHGVFNFVPFIESN